MWLSRNNKKGGAKPLGVVAEGHTKKDKEGESVKKRDLQDK